MNLAKITELKNLINRLYGILKKLRVRKDNLEKEICSAKGAQERLEYAVSSAKNRVSALGTLGLRPEFLEEILWPVQNRPDCSGIGTVVNNELSKTETEIQQTQDKIWAADREKMQLEMEDV